MKVKNTNVLHICKYYIGNKLYTNLFSELASNGITQKVYIPLANESYNNKNYIDVSGVTLIYSKIQNISDRFLYFKKIKKTYRDLDAKININDIDIIHAHSLFTDGGVAYKLNQRYNKPYIVNVRNTDINVFLKYFIHLRGYMLKILLNAEKIVFISPSYVGKLTNKIPKKYRERIVKKIQVIPNAMDNKWIDYTAKESKTCQRLSLVQIGRLDNNKNYITSLKVVEELKKFDEKIIFNIIGDGNQKQKINRYIRQKNLVDNVIMHGHISNFDQIKNILDSSQIFLLPSKRETFGIVYLEAMSRGLPIIYTRGQGIDGFFKEGHIGFAVKHDSTKDILNAINKISNSYSEISKRCIYESKSFNWKDVADKYRELYNNL